MADTVTTVSTLNGWFKTKYAAKVRDLVPDVSKFLNGIPFKQETKIGRKYNKTVELELPQGMTYAAAGAGAFDLEDAEPGETGYAEIDGNQFEFVDMIDHEAASKAMTGSDGSYGDAVGRMVKRMLKAIHKRLELSAWYGQSTGGLGIIATDGIKAEGGGALGGGDTTARLTITEASWAPLIWVGMKNAHVDVADNALAATRNTATLKIKKIDLANRYIYVTLTAGELGTAIATDVLVFRNSIGNEMLGVDMLCQSTGSLWGINGTNYETWTGNTYNCGSTALDFEKLIASTDGAIGKGLDEDVTAWVSNKTWNNLMRDQAALRRHGGGEKTLKNGAKAIEFEGHAGKITVQYHGLIKGGEAYVLTTPYFEKVGTTEPTFQVPGRAKDDFFKLLEKKAGFELRIYANMALFCEAPGFQTKITNIVNN